MRRAAICAAVVLAACGGKSAGKPAAPAPVEPVEKVEAPVEKPVEPPPPPPADDEGVAVLATGDEPRAVLRYELKDKTKRKVDFEMKMGDAGSRKLAWTYDVRKDGDGGGYKITMKATKADAPFKGKTGSWMMSARGRQAGPAWDKSPQHLVLATQAAHMLPVFPDEAVGTGARWTSEIAMTAGLGAAGIPGVTTWELTAIAGSKVTVHGELVVQHDDIVVRSNTNMKIDARAHIDATIDLAALTGEATMTLEMSSETEGVKPVQYTSTSTMKLK